MGLRRKFDPVAMQRRIEQNRLEKQLASLSYGGPNPWLPGKRPHDSIYTTVVVCGTRTFEKYGLFKRMMEKYTFWFDAVEVVIGSEGKRIERGGEWVWIGADALAKRWAEYHWYKRKIFWADWANEGNSAGPKRNTAMARYAAERGGYCVAFWDGESRGTADMIDKFLRYNPEKKLRIVRHEDD